MNVTVNKVSCRFATGMSTVAWTFSENEVQVTSKTNAPGQVAVRPGKIYSAKVPQNYTDCTKQFRVCRTLQQALFYCVHTHLPCPLPRPAAEAAPSPAAMPVLTELTTTLMFLKSRGFAASIVDGSGGGPDALVCRYLH